MPALSANRTACFGSNGERALASNMASGDKHAVAGLPALLDDIAKRTNSKLSHFETYEYGATERHRVYELIDRNGRYVITLSEVSSTSVALSVERACQSLTADGWQPDWATVLSQLRQHGFSLE